MRKAQIFIIISFIFASQNLWAQFNVKVGYSLGYTPAKVHNKMIKEFNGVFEDGTYVGEAMKDLHFLHGLNVGARWKYDFVSLELEWENLSRTRQAIGEDPNTDELFSEKLYYAINNYAVSLESEFGAMGLGVGLGYRQFKVREDVANTDTRRDVMRDNQYFIKPFIVFNFGGGDYVGLAIRPYVSIPIRTINLGLVALELDTEITPVSLPSENEPLWMFGLNFVFYNGFQAR